MTTTTHCPDCLALSPAPAHAREGRCHPCRPPRRTRWRRPPVEVERLADAFV